MSVYVTYFALGLSAGALFAALAQALVIGYRGSGVINLSQGAMAMYVAYVFRSLRVDGALLVPPLPNPLSLVEGIAGWFGAEVQLPDVPAFVDLGGPLAVLPAFLLAQVVAVALGLILHFCVYRPLRSAPPLAKVVASVGVMITLQAVAALRYGTDPVSMPSLLPTGSREILGATMPDSRLVLAAVAVVLAAALTLVYGRTRFGAATEAAAADETGAIVTGLASDRLAAANWVLSSVVGGTVGVLFASVTGLGPTTFTLFVLPALGAALLGNLRSFPIAAAAGLVIGGLQSVTLRLQTTVPWFPDTGAADGIPFVVIIVAMILRGHSLPERGGAATQRLPSSPEPRRIGLPVAVLVPAVAVALVLLPFDFRNGLVTSLSGVVLALSVVVLAGMAGQISLMQLAIAGISAVGMTRIAGDWGIPFPLSPLLAATLATVLGVAASLPALRVRGVHLAVTTLGAAVALHAMVFNNDTVLRTEDAASSVPSPSIGGLGFGINDSFPFGKGGAPSPAFGFFVLFVAAGACTAVANLRRSSTGRLLLAIRSNERAAAGVGIDVARTKILAFAIAAFLAGVAGSLQAYQFQGVSASSYAALGSVTLLAVVYLGGMTSILGAILAGVLVAGGLSLQISEHVFHAGEFEQLIAGLGLLLTAVMNPDGLAGIIKHHIGARQRPAPSRVGRRRRAGSPLIGSAVDA